MVDNHNQKSCLGMYMSQTKRNSSRNIPTNQRDKKHYQIYMKSQIIGV